MTTILITGASGFFGRALVAALGRAKGDARFVCLSKAQIVKTDDPRFHFVHADLLDLSGHKKLMEEIRPDVCIHLAWHVPPKEFWQSPENTKWLEASTHLFGKFCRGGGRVFIGAGTTAEYDWAGGFLDEATTPLAPHTLYGQCKKALYEAIREIRNREHGDVAIIWPRIGYFFGPQESPQKLIPRIIESVRNDTPMHLVARRVSRPYAHVRHLGDCFSRLAFERTSDLTFNLSTAHSHSFEEIVNFTAETMKATPRHITYGDEAAMGVEPLNLRINTLLFKESLGYDIPDTFFADLKALINGQEV